MACIQINQWISTSFVFLLIAAVVKSSSIHKADSKECYAAQYCNLGTSTKQTLAEHFNLTNKDTDESFESQSDGILLRTCSCHPSCYYFDNCCSDVPEKDVHLPELATRLMSDSDGYQCVKALGEWVTIVSTCPANTHKILSEKCLKVPAADMYEFRVTSNVTSLTYKNIFCGICNGEKIQDLLAWRLNFICEGLPTFEKSNKTTTTAPVNPDITKGNNILALALEQGCELNKSIPFIPPDLEIHSKISNFLDQKNKCSNPPISSCPARTSDADRQLCLKGANAYVNYKDEVYRNIHCLKCNVPNYQPDDATCESCDVVENGKCVHAGHIEHQSILATFGVLVQAYPRDDRLTCKKEDGSACSGLLRHLPRCGPGQYIDYMTSTCKNLCPPTSVLKEGECVFDPVECNTYESYAQFTNAANSGTVSLRGMTFIMNSSNSYSCFNCSKLAGGEKLDISQHANGSYIHNGHVIPRNVFYRSEEYIYVCIDGISITNGFNSVKVEEYITVTLLSLSILSILLFAVAYCLFKRMKNIPGKIVAGHMSSLLLAYVFFLLRLALTENSKLCYIVAVFINYFFLAAFVFTIIYAGFIVHSLGFLDFESSVTKWTAVRMWILGLTAPFMIIVPGLITDSLGSATINFAPHYGGKECFMEGFGMVIYFISPIALCLFIDLCLYLVIIIKLVQIAKETQKVRSHHREKIVLSVKLLFVLGFLWIFAVLAAATDNITLDFIFIATCTLQGVAGFVVFVCNASTVKDLKARYAAQKLKSLSETDSGKPMAMRVVDTASTNLTLKSGLLSSRKDSAAKALVGERL